MTRRQRPAQVSKNPSFLNMQRTLCEILINFRVPKATRRDTQETRKSLFPNWKQQKNHVFENIFFRKFFLWIHSAENGTLGSQNAFFMPKIFMKVKEVHSDLTKNFEVAQSSRKKSFPQLLRKHSQFHWTKRDQKITRKSSLRPGPVKAFPSQKTSNQSSRKN